MRTLQARDFRNRTLLALGLLPLVACGEPDTECISLPANGTCPSADEAAETLLGDHCGYVVNAVTGEGTITEVPTWDTGVVAAGRAAVGPTSVGSTQPSARCWRRPGPRMRSWSTPAWRPSRGSPSS